MEKEFKLLEELSFYEGTNRFEILEIYKEIAITTKDLEDLVFFKELISHFSKIQDN